MAKHQKIPSSGKILQSHSFNKYHSAAKLDTVRSIPSKNLFRMADRFRKTARVRSPQLLGAKTTANPHEDTSIRQPIEIEQPEMTHLATEVPNEHGYEDEP